jgi:uncharacterized protein YecE (DUF72 family)
MGIRIGSCGWQYDDWVGPFYPPEKRDRKGEWLEYYGRFFDCVEIDSSFYSVPGRHTVDAWIKKGNRIRSGYGGPGAPRGAGDFEFSLKMNQDVTHLKMVEGSAGEAVARARDFETSVCRPLADNGLLGAVLLQLSPYFPMVGKDQRSNVPILQEILEGLATDKYRYVVEFRHRTWLNSARKEIAPEALELLRGRRAAVCILDGPGFPTTHAQTADHAYIRFHGRNEDIWYKKDKPEGDTRINRYDYLYKEEELNPWVDELRSIDERAREVRVVFNNHGHAKAVHNGLQLRKMLGVEAPGKESAIPKKITLDSF